MSASNASGNGLRGAEKVAVILMMMGERKAAAVMQHMDERAIGAVSDIMGTVPKVESETALELLGDLLIELDGAGVSSAGGFPWLKRVLVNAFGEQRALEMIEKALRSGGGTIDVLTNVDPKSLAEQVGGENPQMLAVLLGHMTKSAAVAFLNSIDSTLPAEIIYRYAKMDTIQPVALGELREMLSEMLGGHVSARVSAIGGVRQAADILNGMGAEAADHAIGRIRQLDSGLAEKIRDSMFTFDDLMRLDDQSLQLVLRNVPQERIAPALRAASIPTKDRMLTCVSSKAAIVIVDEIENGQRVTRADAQAAQKEICEVALRLAEQGTISLGGQEDML